MPLHLVFALMLFCFSSINGARVLLALYALELGAQPVTVGLLFATYFIFPMVLSWPLGVLSDRFGSRWLLLLGAVCGACGMLIPYFVHTLPAIFIAGTMIGLAFTFYKILLENLVGLLSKPHERARNFSNSSMVGATTGFLGPLGAGISIDYFGHASACLYIVGLSLAAVVLLAMWGRVLPGGQRPSGAAGSVRDLLADPGILRVLAMSSFVQVAQDFFQFYLPVYGHSIGLSASAIGAVLGSFAVASFVVRFALPRLIARLGEEMLLAYAFYVAAAGFMLMPFSTSGLALGAFSFLFGLGLGCGQPITMMLMFACSATGRSGETFGLRQTTNNVLRVTTPTLFGFLASAFGLLPMFGLNALILVAGGLLSQRSSPRRDSPPR